MGKKIGSGHFYRCLAIAKELSKQNKNIIFLVKNEKELLLHLGDLQFPYLIPDKNSDKKFIINCKKLQSRCRSMIIDMPTQNELYSKALSTMFKTAVIDDTGSKKIYSNLVFNGQIVKKFHEYDIQNKLANLFFGSKFFICREEFHKSRNNFTISKKPIRKILIVFGGSDESDLTRKIIPILLKQRYKITVVLGPSYSHKNYVLEKYQDDDSIDIKINPEKISSLFVKHDLVLSSSGTTAYELAYLGIPTIFIPVDKDQIEIAEELAKRGFGVNYGQWDNDHDRLMRLISQFDNKKRLCAFNIGRKIIDGRGLQRITKKLIKMNDETF